MHASKEIQAIEKSMLKDTIPSFRAGDTIRVHARIKEGGKERIQNIEGVVLRRSGAGATKTFTVRKISNGVGVEIIYPVYSPTIAKIEVVTNGDVRRSKLYYLRKLTGKAAKLKSRDTTGQMQAPAAGT